MTPGTTEKLEEMGVSAGQILRTWPNKIHSLGDVQIRTTFAIPFSGDDWRHHHGAGHFRELADRFDPARILGPGLVRPFRDR